MGKIEEKAKDVIKKLTQENKTIDEVKAMYPGDQEWFGVSNKAYNIRLAETKKENKKNETRPNVSSTSNDTIAVRFKTICVNLPKPLYLQVF